MHPVCIIKTPLGNAVRGPSEAATVIIDGEECIETVPSLIVPKHVAKEDYSVVQFADDDLPPRDGTTTIRNICGFVSEYAVMADHPAWRCQRSALGNFNEAYTLRGGELSCCCCCDI